MTEHCAEAPGAASVRGARRLASVSFGMAAVSLGLLLGTGPVSIVLAPLASIAGGLDLMLLQPSTPAARRQSGYHRAVVATTLGAVVTAASVLVMAGSRPT